MLIFEGDEYDEREGIYVGKTSISFKRRWKQHDYSAVNEKAARAKSNNPDCFIGRHVLLDASLIPIKFWDDSLLSSLELLMNALLGATQGANMNCNIVDTCDTNWISTLTISCVQRLYDRTFAFATEHGFLSPRNLFSGRDNDGKNKQITNSVAWRAVLGDALVHEVTVTFKVQLTTAIAICLGASWKNAYKNLGMASQMAKLQAGWDKQKQQDTRVDKIRSIAMALALDQKNETSPTLADGMEATTFKPLVNPVAVTKLRSMILALDQKNKTSPTLTDGMEATTFKPLANPVAVTKLCSVILALNGTNPVKEED